MAIQMSREARHEAIIGIAGVVSIIGAYIVFTEYRDYKAYKEGLQMKDVVKTVQDTATKVIPSSDDVIGKAKRTVKTLYDKATGIAGESYRQVRRLIPF